VNTVSGKHYIGGEWLDSSSEETFESFNPYNGQPWYVAAMGSDEDVDRAVKAARGALEDPAWRDLTASKRGALLRKLGDVIGENAEELARLETMDNGKLIREMRGQLRTLPEWYYYFSGIADKVQGEVIPALRPEILNYTLREGVGVVGAITPWNSPLLLLTMKLAPALAAGNSIVIKPSEHSSASTLRLMSLVEQAGFPRGVVNVVTGRGEAGAALAAHPNVDKIAFTGGSDTGRIVGQAAIGHFARVTLELGGKSAQLVFPDANVEAATAGLVAGIFAAAGQSCIAGSRAFIHEDLYDEVVELIGSRARGIQLGNPLDDETELGPLALRQQLDKVEHYVAVAREEGANLVAGGARPANANGGWFYLPTVFADVQNDMTIAQEEIFGPVLAVLRFRDEAEAIKLANQTRFGLAAGIWTRDLARAHRVAAGVNAGTVWINTYRAISPMSPFGGFGASGLGKENGFAVMNEYTRLKSVWVNTSDEPPEDPFVLR
jgi:(Z)-2-((N-methylformamido)methylene)-5-hydroxybutyrolactone dehydrogenase